VKGFPEGNAVIYCEGAFRTPNGKTAHGLVRRTQRYRVLSVVDSACAGEDAGTLLDGKANGIPIYASIGEAAAKAESTGRAATHLVIGLAPDGGRLSPAARKDVMAAIELQLNVDCGLHDFLTDDEEIAALAERYGVDIRDVRKPPPRSSLHFFSGKIEQVTSWKVALLGTDSAVGKRTTAWLLADALEKVGYRAQMIGTGQTAWMQGAKYAIILDALVNDFVSGEIEHVVWTAWQEASPDVMIVEGQGSLMNPAYPGGFEILAAARPDVVVLQHAPARKDYDGFPGYPIHPLKKQIEAVELLSGKPVVAITVNHEDLDVREVPSVCRKITVEIGLPAVDVLREGGVEQLVSVMVSRMTDKQDIPS
jgi:uncharacterized NAD-dependent epimerase/dehydratase family protein